MKSVTADKLAAMSAEAAQVPRRRTHFTLHDDLADPVQRVVLGLQPGTYVRPHRHAAGVWELFALVRGACAVLTFDEAGRVTGRVELRPGAAALAQVPEDTWHSIVCLEPDTIAFEIKPGPYRPATDKDFAAWAPREGEEGAPAMVRWLEGAACGETAPEGLRP